MTATATPRNARTVTPALRKRALFLLAQAVDQERWVADHGGDLPGYVARYGAAADPARYGDGGEAIHAADAAACERWWALYSALPAHVRAAVEATDKPERNGVCGRLATPAERTQFLAEWFDFCRHVDLFGTNYAGYWAYGVSVVGADTTRHWLVFVGETEGERPGETETAIVETLHRNRDAMPSTWHVWGPTQWAAAYRYGERLWGERWYDHHDTDATRYDTIMQLALLGEVRYG